MGRIVDKMFGSKQSCRQGFPTVVLLADNLIDTTGCGLREAWLIGIFMVLAVSSVRSWHERSLEGHERLTDRVACAIARRLEPDGPAIAFPQIVSGRDSDDSKE